MAHSKKLIDDCVKVLSADYPIEQYNYVLEKGLNGARVLPDIQIIKGDSVVCVVEIGYTRPDKIQTYRNREINDIRWYDTNMNLVLKESSEEYQKQRELENAQGLEERVILNEIRKDSEIRAKRARELLDRTDFFVALEGICSDCDDEGLCGADEDQGSTEYLYFDRKRYKVNFECENNSEHDYNEEYDYDN